MRHLPSPHRPAHAHVPARDRALVATLVAVLAAGCAAADTQPTPLEPLVAPAATPRGEETLNAGPGLRTAVQAALADAARHSGLPVAALSVISAESVTWADGSLGCPQTGAAYTMALVPGHRVRIRAQGQTLDFHSDTRGHQVLCPAGRAIEPIPEARR